MSASRLPCPLAIISIPASYYCHFPVHVQGTVTCGAIRYSLPYQLCFTFYAQPVRSGAGGNYYCPCWHYFSGPRTFKTIILTVNFMTDSFNRFHRTIFKYFNIKTPAMIHQDLRQLKSRYILLIQFSVVLNNNTIIIKLLLK